MQSLKAQKNWKLAILSSVKPAGGCNAASRTLYTSEAVLLHKLPAVCNELIIEKNNFELRSLPLAKSLSELQYSLLQ